MGDKASETILAALGRAAIEPGGLPLHGILPAGLFSSSTAAKKAAQFCKTQGYLQVTRTEPRGRGLREICAITEKGLAYLFHQASPKPVLEELVRALHGQQSQASELLMTVRQWQANIDSFKSLVNKCLHQGNHNGRHFDSSFSVRSMEPKRNHESAESTKTASSTLGERILSILGNWQESGDCPLPEIYHRIRANQITIGQFHDELRRLHKEEQIYLHPWTGPLPEISEPALALFVGHVIAYYASRRFSCP